MGKWRRIWTAVKIGAAVALTVKKVDPKNKAVVEEIVEAVDHIAEKASGPQAPKE